MAFCSKCGAQVDDALKFCMACGTQRPQAQQPVQQPVRQPVQQPMQQPYMQPQYQQPHAPVAPPPPAKKKSKAPLVIIVLVIIGGLAAAGILTKGFGLFGGKGGAIPVSIITGENATLTKGGKSGQAAKEGAQLTAGSRLATGAETCVYLKADKDSLIKMNEYSEISVSEISGSVLKFELIQGSVLINETGKEGRLHMTAGNSYLIVRGTFFTAKYDSDAMVVDLIEGEIDVATESGSVTSVVQGERVTVIGNGDAEVDALDISNFDAFTMDSVMEFKDALKHGSLTEEDFSRISDRWKGNGGSDVGEDGQPIYDGSIPEDWPIYDDSAIGDWGGDGGGSDAGTGGDSEAGPGGGGGGSDVGEPYTQATTERTTRSTTTTTDPLREDVWLA